MKVYFELVIASTNLHRISDLTMNVEVMKCKCGFVRHINIFDYFCFSVRTGFVLPDVTKSR